MIILNKKDISKICRWHGWQCRIDTKIIQHDAMDCRTAQHYRYYDGNAVEVSQDGNLWQWLGWLWDVETLTMPQIVTALHVLQGEQNKECE